MDERSFAPRALLPEFDGADIVLKPSDISFYVENALGLKIPVRF